MTEILFVSTVSEPHYILPIGRNVGKVLWTISVKKLLYYLKILLLSYFFPVHVFFFRYVRSVSNNLQIIYGP